MRIAGLRLETRTDAFRRAAWDVALSAALVAAMLAGFRHAGIAPSPRRMAAVVAVCLAAFAVRLAWGARPARRMFR